MFDAPVRQVLGRWLAPLARGLATSGVSPNAITVGAAVIGVGAAGLVASGRPVVGYAVWLVSRLLDAFDGIVARESGRATPFGGFLDITLDMVAYSAMVLAFAQRHPEHPLLWSGMVTGYLLVTTTTLALSSSLEARRAAVPGNDRSLQFTPGFAEAGETSLAYALMLLFPGAVVEIGWSWVVLCFATVIQRVLLARRLLRP